MEENKLLEKIKKSAEQTPIPESIKPEAMFERIDGMKQDEALTGDAGKKKKFSIFRMGGAAAACLVVALGLWQLVNIGIDLPREEAGMEEGIENVGAEKAGDAMPEKGPENEMPPQEVEPLETEPQELPVEGINVPEDYDEVYKKLKRKFYRSDFEQWVDKMLDRGSYIVEDMVAEKEMSDGAAPGLGYEEVAAEESGAENAADKSGDYSKTNIHEKGVDEADIVKTDGKYIYIAETSGTVHIVETDGKTMKKASEIEIENLNERLEEIYVDGDILNIVACGAETTLEEEETEDYYAMKRRERVKLYTYDISDRKHPKQTGIVTQDGSYRDSRKVGDYVYLFTSYMAKIQGTEEDSDYIPVVQEKEILAEDICMPSEIMNSTYLVVSSVNVEKPNEVKDKKAILSAAEYFYASTENIYISNTLWTDSGDVTQIMKYHYENGYIMAVAAGEVHGRPNDQFSFSENDGYLRVVTLEWAEQPVTHLYVLDEKLNLCGKIEDLAPGETLRSSRFMGDTGYFVTFKNMDPLFSVDLSDPENPKILGELKITGFSEYLNFWGEDKLLGLGYEVEPDSGETKGIKLSMFDISDPTDVKEVNKYVIKDERYCSALYDYKSMLMDPDKGLAGFMTNGKYMVFSYTPEAGFTNEFIYDMESEFNSESGFMFVRGLYIDKTFYLTDTKEVKMFDMSESYSLMGELEL